jgi:hypothetical protein
MANKSENSRPKIVSFNESLSGLDAIAFGNILWPCYAFDVTVPQKKKDLLNIFEKTILKVTEIETNDTTKIADIVCLDKDLVSFIQNRLHHLKLLDERYRLSKNGKDLMDDMWSKPESGIEYVSATIFVNALSGEIMPYISTNKPIYKEIVSLRRGFIGFLPDSTNENYKLNSRKIPLKRGYRYDGKTPSARDVSATIKSFKKRYKSYALLNKDAEQYPSVIPTIGAITVTETPELIYLNCRTIVNSNADFLVTDGLGFGLSSDFSSYLIKENYSWITELKRKGAIQRLDKTQSVSNKDIKYKYKNISQRLLSAETNLKHIKTIEINKASREKEFQQKIGNIIRDLYLSFEWAFRQVVNEYPADGWEYLLSGNTPEENKDLLVGLAKKSGFSMTDKNKTIFKIKMGAIHQTKKNGVELQSLFALAIVGASFKSKHCIHSLVETDPNFISFIQDLKEKRDSISHGGMNRVGMGYSETIDYLAQLVDGSHERIKSLVPDIAGDLVHRNSLSDSRQGREDQGRLKAVIGLEERFGVCFIGSLKDSIKDDLIRIEAMTNKYSDNEVIEIIVHYASTVQMVLYEAVRNVASLDSSKDSVQIAINRIVQTGFYSSVNDIPESITKTNKTTAIQAMQGYNKTLGAQLLSLFFLGSDSQLKQLKTDNPGLVKLIARLISLRGHGSVNPAISEKEVKLLKNDLLDVIKAIIGVFYE